MNAQKRKAVSQERRRNRVRRVVRGTADRPRLTVFRSSKHIYVQLIDDDQGKTLVAASTVSPELKGKVNYGRGCWRFGRPKGQVRRFEQDLL